MMSWVKKSAAQLLHEKCVEYGVKPKTFISASGLSANIEGDIYVGIYTPREI
jgi:hypothetical protein